MIFVKIVVPGSLYQKVSDPPTAPTAVGGIAHFWLSDLRLYGFYGFDCFISSLYFHHLTLVRPEANLPVRATGNKSR